MIALTVTRALSDEGSLILFEGLDDEDRAHTFGVEHRPATALLFALAEGERPEVEVPRWSILGGPR